MFEGLLLQWQQIYHLAFYSIFRRTPEVSSKFFVHSSFFPTFDFFKKYVAFCTGFNLLTPIFMSPYIIMDLPTFVIAEWATLLVDIRCSRGGS